MPRALNEAQPGIGNRAGYPPGRTQIDQFGRDPDGQADRRTAVQNGGDARLIESRVGYAP